MTQSAINAALDLAATFLGPPSSALPADLLHLRHMRMVTASTAKTVKHITLKPSEPQGTWKLEPSFS